jgi:hypothetical protein
MKFNQPPSSVHVSNGWSQTTASPINLSGTDRYSFTSFTFYLHQFSLKSVIVSE